MSKGLNREGFTFPDSWPGAPVACALLHQKGAPCCSRCRTSWSAVSSEPEVGSRMSRTSSSWLLAAPALIIRAARSTPDPDRPAAAPAAHPAYTPGGHGAAPAAPARHLAGCGSGQSSPTMERSNPGDRELASRAETSNRGPGRCVTAAYPQDPPARAGSPGSGAVHGPLG